MTFTKNFKEVQQYQGLTMRSVARSLALDVLALKNRLQNVEHWYKRPRIQFLFIHHIFNDEVKTFELLLEKLSKHHTFISHSEAVEKVLSGNIDRPYISWSSDDGFKNNLKAAEILNRYDAKACFFINPNSIGSKEKEWISRFCKERLNMPPVEFLEWDDVTALQKFGHEIGSHTLNHRNIARMNFDEITHDLVESKKILEKHCGHIKHFAYPYGRYYDFSKQAFDSVFETGYDSCSTGERGCHISNASSIDKHDLLIRRDQVICAWKLQHIMYFIANGAKKANFSDNFFPETNF